MSTVPCGGGGGGWQSGSDPWAAKGDPMEFSNPAHTTADVYGEFDGEELKEHDAFGRLC